MLYLKSANLKILKRNTNLLLIPLPMKMDLRILRLDVQEKEFEIKILPGYINAEKGIDLADGWVPETDFFLWDDEKIVGLFRVRHYLTPALANGGGHIGYGIKKEFRGKGYASEGLRLTIEKARTLLKKTKYICLFIGIIWHLYVCRLKMGPIFITKMKKSFIPE